jgi:hypothetical protein
MEEIDGNAGWKNLKKQIKNIFRILDNLIGKRLFSVISINDKSIERYTIDKREYHYEHTKTNELHIISENVLKKQLILDSHHYQKENLLHKANIYKLSGAKFKISKGGFVIFRNRKVLIESCNHEEIYFFRYFSKIGLKIKLFRLKNINVKHAYVLEHNLDFNYWHLHAELIPQLGLIIKTYFNAGQDRISIVIRKDFPVGYRKMLLEIFGESISLKENSNGFIKPDFIYVTSKLYNRALQISGNLIQSRNFSFWDSLNDFKSKLTINSNSDLMYDVLLISRSNAASRRLLNENDLVSVLIESNLKVNVVRLEQYTWLEQLGILNSAKVILAPHGAHSASLLYVKPSLYIEIVSFDRARGLFPIMDVENICQFQGIHAIFVDSGNSSNKFEDYTICKKNQKKLTRLTAKICLE